MHSEVRKAHHIILPVSFVLGAIIGHLLIHPYAMVACSMMDMHRQGHMSIDMGHVMQSARSIFEPFMLPMTIAFAVLCGLIALLMAVLCDRKRILNEALIENERKKASLETLDRVMVTLSHYLLNANTVIGGMVATAGSTTQRRKSVHR